MVNYVSDTYDGLVSSGALALGQLNQDCFPELIRIVKPGKLWKYQLF